MDNQSDKKWYETYKGWAIALAVIIVIFLWYRSGQNGFQWEGDGTVNLFPSSAISKNYRLDANIEVTRKVKGLLTIYYEYKIRNVTWPNGGNVTFDKQCIISTKDGKKSARCVIDSKEYNVEVDTAPEIPRDDRDIENGF